MRLEQAIQTSGFRSEGHRAEVNLLYTAYEFRTAFAQCLKGEDFTVEQYNVMRILKGSHPRKMCVRDIASRMIERSSNVPRIVDRLVAKQWVLRSQGEADRRETVVALTPKGITALEKASRMMNEKAAALTKLSDEEFAQLNALLDKWRG